MSSERNNFLSGIKDKLLFTAWIAILVFATVLIWTLTKPLLTSYMLRSVNQSLVAYNMPYKLSAGKAADFIINSPPGFLFPVENSSDNFFVFTMFSDGVMSLCGAYLSRDDSVFMAQEKPAFFVREIIPISAHSVNIFTKISPGIIKMYTRKINNAAAQWSTNE